MSQIEPKDLFSILPAIAACIAAYIAIRNNDITIRMARTNSIIESVAAFLKETNPQKGIWDKLEQLIYVSDEHVILENKIIMLLDDRINVEADLIETIKLFRTQSLKKEEYHKLAEKALALSREIIINERNGLSVFNRVARMFRRPKAKALID